MLRARLTAETGALVVKALEMALDRRGDEAGDVTVETSAAEREPIAARRPDALAEAYLNGDEPAGSTADR